MGGRRTYSSDSDAEVAAKDASHEEARPGRSSFSLAEVTIEQIQEMEREELLALWFRIHRSLHHPSFVARC